ncbi:hypothetical protein M9H77_20819 [Catharanthus roseus]|uniref:Uncharacterized protein n=1 Tax=Catharanthus roseus TaxID=4058 RepID=A0ACC0AL97_CATRO|nr:hypothetical protein M9H77_20819 [Catharanthus roseus]
MDPIYYNKKSLSSLHVPRDYQKNNLKALYLSPQRQALSSLNQATRTVSRMTTGTDYRRQSPEGQKETQTDSRFERRERRQKIRESVWEAAAASTEKEEIRAGWEKRTLYSQVAWVGSG